MIVLQTTWNLSLSRDLSTKKLDLIFRSLNQLKPKQLPCGTKCQLCKCNVEFRFLKTEKVWKCANIFLDFFHRELCSFAFSKCKYMNWCILLLESLITNIERVMIRRVDIEFQQLFLKHFLCFLTCTDEGGNHSFFSSVMC